MRDSDRAHRVRIAALLLAPRDSEGVVRAPLSDAQTLATIKNLRAPQRAALTSQVNFVREYEREEGGEL